MSTRGYLESLRQQGKERSRLTKQLQRLVSAALDVIAMECEPGTSFRVPESNIDLTVTIIETAFATHTVITILHSGKRAFWDGAQHRVFQPDRSPWAKWFLDDDFDCEIGNAGRDDWLTVAGSLPAIAAGFLASDTKVREAVRTAIRNLRIWSEQ